MRHAILLVATLTWAGAMAPAPAMSAGAGPERAEVLVLGVYHMANPGLDVFNLQADDVLSPQRQREIGELTAVLKRFRPTKVAVESNDGTDTQPKRYAEYLAGTQPLTRNEIQQIGFRLAREMGHSTVYPVDADGDFPLPRVSNFAKATGQSARYDTIMSAGWGAMVKEQGEYLATHTVLQTLALINADARVARDVGYYYQLARFGEPGDYAGPDLLAEWYRRNVRIYNNVARLIESPGDRILVIFGYGHLGWLRQQFAADPSLRLRTLEEFAPATPRARR